MWPMRPMAPDERFLNLLRGISGCRIALGCRLGFTRLAAPRARTKFSSILSGLLFLSQNLAPGLRLLGTPLALRCHAVPCKRVSMTTLLIAQYHFVHVDIRDASPLAAVVYGGEDTPSLFGCNQPFRSLGRESGTDLQGYLQYRLVLRTTTKVRTHTESD